MPQTAQQGCLRPHAGACVDPFQQQLMEGKRVLVWLKPGFGSVSPHGALVPPDPSMVKWGRQCPYISVDAKTRPGDEGSECGRGLSPPLPHAVWL